MQTKGVSRFIEVGSELAWIDQTRKKGGVEDFEPTRRGPRTNSRMDGECGPATIKEKSADSIPSSGKSLFSGVQRSVTDAARRSAERLAVFLQDLRLARLRTGFSSGLVVGFLASAFVGAVFLLLSHTRELGNSLIIQIGEELGGRTRSQSTSPAQASSNNPQLADSVSKPLWPELESTASVALAADPPSNQTSRQEEFLSPAMRTVAKRNGVKLEPPNSGTHSPSGPRLDASTPRRGTIYCAQALGYSYIKFND